MPTVSSQIDVNLSTEVKQVLHIAGCKAREYLHASCGAPHLLWALLNKKISTYHLVRDWGKDIFYLQEWASVRLEEYPKANGAVTNIEASKELTEILNEADQLRFELENDKVDVICLLAVLCIPGLAFSYDQLKTLPLSKEEILQAAYGETLHANDEQTENATSLSLANNSSDALLNEYCHDKQKELSEKKHFQLIERKEEIKTCLEILSRYAKANLILIGEPGVGKTALIDGLVEQVDKENVPENLKHARLLELDVAAMQAGASYKGEQEDRFQKIIAALKSLDKSILLIEDIHALLDKQNNLSSLSNLLLVELNRGDVTVIGTTTPENFRKTIEKEETFARRFETLKLEEPSDENAATIIRTVIKPHENHHNLHISDTTIKEAIRLSKRYDKERHLPDAAIDLIDRCMARVRITVNRSDALLKELKKAFRQYQNSDKADLSEVRKQYAAFMDVSGRLLKNHFDFTLKDQANFEDDSAFVSWLDTIISEIDTFEGAAKEIINADLAEIISRKTGIPIGKIQARERKRLLGMEEALRQRVVGQDNALKSVSEAVLESRSGLMKSGQPIGSFFLLGPTGTGKTELAKALSEFLFQDEQAMIRFDMSEFKEEHSAALLYGSPPGYVGYEEGGMLVNKIREKPYSVVLFDEIEKAHSSVFDIFLQILDEGKLNDRLGKEGDFSNAVILFTSNIASEHITKVFEEEGRLPSSQRLMEKLSGHFRPEFLGRLTEIVPFGPISEEVLLRIFEIHLTELLQASTRKEITMELGIETKKYLAQLGYSPQYGARPIKGVIRDKIRRPLSRMLIEGKIEGGSRVQLSLDNNHQLQWNVN